MARGAACPSLVWIRHELVHPVAVSIDMVYRIRSSLDWIGRTAEDGLQCRVDFIRVIRVGGSDVLGTEILGQRRIRNVLVIGGVALSASKWIFRAMPCNPIPGRIGALH